MTDQDKLLDKEVLNQIALRRFIRGRSNTLLKLFERYDRRLATLLRRRLRGVSSIRDQDFKDLLVEIVDLRKELMEKSNTSIKNTQEDLAPVEHNKEWLLLLATLGLAPGDEPSTATLGAVNSTPFATGAASAATLNQWLADLRKADYTRIRDALILGVNQGDTLDTIVARIIGTKDQDYRDGAVARTRHNSQALITTALIHLSQVIRENIWRETKEVKGLVWMSILDGRTSDICISRDNKVVMYGNHTPPKGMELLSPQGARPPAHPHCRSLMGALVGSAPPTRLTFETWFDSQTKKVQDDILGKTKAQLHRDRKLPLDELVDDTGKTLTLDQLKE